MENKKNWEKLLDKFPEANFLQSWTWGKFHQNLGNKIYRIAISGKGLTLPGKVRPYKISGLFLAIIETAKRGKYLTIPGGPLLKKWNEKTFKRALQLIKEIAQKENCSFIRIRPQVMDTLENRKVVQKFGFRPAPMHLHAELTRILDLTKSDEELLKEMRKTTRYEIKKGQKMGIKVYQSNDEKLIDDFCRLQMETAQRENFIPFSRKYLLEQFRTFNKNRTIKLFYITESEKNSSCHARTVLNRTVLNRPVLNKPISMAFIIFYRGEVIYHYAASSIEARKIPAAYAIQWAIIQEAKKRKCKIYNLWGDVPDDQLRKHRFAGPSLFKRGFGGDQIAYLHAHDLPLSWKYWIDWGVETLRKNYRKL